MKLELENYVALNEARVEFLVQLEQNSTTIIELDFKVKAQLNEIINLKLNIEHYTSQNAELKDQNKKLEEKYWESLLKMRLFMNIKKSLK